MKKAVFGILAFASVAAAAPAVQAATTIAAHYTRVSAGENIIAPFTAPNGVSSVGTYTGPVEVLVSGTGFSNGSLINDAFGPYGTGYYSLGIGTSAEPLAPYQPGRTATRFITFIDGLGAVPLGTAPAYSTSHVYRFVADIGSLSSQLSFGVLDGIYADNGGAYELSIWQLRPGSTSAVPEPATWMMMILGFGLMGAAMRRQKPALLATA